MVLGTTEKRGTDGTSETVFPGADLSGETRVS